MLGHKKQILVIILTLIISLKFFVFGINAKEEVLGEALRVITIPQGGTGTSTLPSYGQLLMGNNSNGYNLVSTSSLGLPIIGSLSSGEVVFAGPSNTLNGDSFFTYNSSTRRLRLGYGSGFSTFSIVATSTSGLTVGENSSVNLLPSSNNSDSVGGVLYTAGNTGATAGITMSPPTYVGGLFTASNNADVNLNSTRGSGLLGRFTFGDGRTNFATGLWGEISNTGGYATSSAAIYAAPGIFTAGNVTTSYSILSDPQITGITKWNLAVNGGNSFINDKLVVGVSSTKAAVLAVVASSSTALPFLILDSSGVTSSQFYADSLTVGKSASNSQGVFNISNLDPWFGTISASGSIFINNSSSAPASVGNTVTMSGAGTRLMWIPDKGAFRAGQVSGTEWDEANIGTDSVAFGKWNKASGAQSVAFGVGSTASGARSMAFGNGSQALSLDSVAFGSGAIANATNAFALGEAIRVNGSNSFGIKLDSSGTQVVDRANVMSILGGTVGIGTVSPDYLLTLGGNNAAIGIGNGSTTSTLSSNQLIIASSTTNQSGVFNVSSTGAIYALSSLFLNNGTSSPPGVGNTVTISGEGTRLMWIPDKAAFRAGYINGTQWDETSIGAYSSAFGQNNTAGGANAMSFGNGNTINGDNAVGIGRSNNLNSTSADDSVGIGRSNSVSTADSVAIGLSNTIGTSNQGYALGWANNISGNLGFGIGDQNFVSVTDGYAFGRANVVDTNSYAMALGFSNSVSGVGTTANWAIGTSNGVTASDAFAIGKGNVASNTGAAAIGDSNTASGQYATTIGGRNLTVSGNYSLGVNLDDTTRTVSQNNTMAVMGGKVGINTTTPNAGLSLWGSYSTIYKNVTSSYTVLNTDNSIVVTSTANIVVTMPAASSNDGLEITIFQDSATSTADVVCSGGCLVNNSTTSTLTGLGNAVTLKAMNGKWYAK